MSDKNKINYSFPSSVTISDCADILEEINAIDFDGNEVIFDASQVENIDTAGVQMIVSICSQEDKKGDFKEKLSMSDNLKASLISLGM